MRRQLLRVSVFIAVFALMELVSTYAVADLVITGSVTWYRESNPTILNERVEIAEGATLTIRPGVIVRCAQTITVLPVVIEVMPGATLDARGTGALPILFTPDSVAPVPGQWATIIVHDGATAWFDHCTFEYGGGLSDAALAVASSSVELLNSVIRESAGGGLEISGQGNTAVIENVTIENCAGPAIVETVPDMAPQFEALQLSGNEWDGVLVREGTVASAITWRAAGAPYIMEGWLDIVDGGGVMLDPGVEVRFKDTTTLLQSSIRVFDGGVFRALGTPESPVHFGSALPSPSPGDWGYVRIHEGAVGNFAYCEFSNGGSAGNPTVWIQSSLVEMNQCAVRNGQSHGILLDGDGLTPILNGLTVENCGGAAMRWTTPNMDPAIDTACSFSGNAEGDVVYIFADGGLLTTSVTWERLNVPYVLSGWLNVQDEATLTLSAGVEVRFGPAETALQSNIRVHGGGRLDAAGTAGAPVRFTSFSGLPVPGDWGYIQFSGDGSGELTHCVLEFAGNFDSPAVIVEAPDVVLRDVEISNSLADGIRIGAGIAPIVERLYIHDCGGWALSHASATVEAVLSDIVAWSNGADGIRIQAGSGPMTRDARWTACGAPYIVEGGLEIGLGSTLTIDPGVVVQFAPLGNSLQSHIAVLDGSGLNARGLEDNRILFTSMDGLAAPGAWAHVQVLDGGTAFLENCTIEYGGQWTTGMLDIRSSSVAIERCLIRNSASEGVRVDDGAVPLFIDNEIAGNLGYGVLNTVPGNVIDARNTWWGDASGPNHPVLNPDGLGNAVSNGVLFDPALGVPLIGAVLNVSGGTRLRVPVPGGSLGLQVRNTGGGTIAWTAFVTKGHDWLSVDAARAAADGVVDISAAANDADYQRVGRIQISAPEAGGGAVTVIIAQAGRLGVGGPHSSDVDTDRVIDLIELLRVIQFYNSAEFHCETGTEDGFAPGSGDQTCAPHDSDYSTQDWQININELLRIIQFYNSGGYHNDGTSEDSFGAGIIP